MSTYQACRGHPMKTDTDSKLIRIISNIPSDYLIIFLILTLTLTCTPIKVSQVYASSSPATPTGLEATPGSSKVTLRWQTNQESDLLFYRVYMDGTYYRTYNKATTLIELTGLKAERDYRFGVTA